MYFLFLAYNGYKYYQSAVLHDDASEDLSKASYKSDKENYFLMLTLLTVGMVAFSYKTNRTLKALYLDPNGRQTFLELYRRFGFSSRILLVDNQ